MNRVHMSILFACSAAAPMTAALAGPVAFPDGAAPPAWSGPSTVAAAFDFPSGAPSGPADAGFTGPPGRTPTYQIEQSDHAAHFPSALGKEGVWCLTPPAAILLTIPNFGPSEGPKYMRVEIKYLPGIAIGGGPPGGVPNVDAQDDQGNPFTAGGVPGFPATVQTRTLPDHPNWLVDTWYFSLFYNPFQETVRIRPIGAALYVDWVTVNTICTPTPGAGCALLAGGAMLAARRRRTP